MMRNSLASLALLLTATTGVAAATEGEEASRVRRRAAGVHASTSYRLLAIGLGDVRLDEQGTTSGRNAWLEQRLRVLSDVSTGALVFSYGGDLFSGTLAGDTSDVGRRFLHAPRDELDAWRGFELRRAMVSWRTPYGELRAGHQVSDWGFGILANSGERELPFGDQRLGDMVERLAFATRPLAWLYAAAGADLVFRDSNADLLEGDLGFNVFGALFHHEGRRFLGLYAAHRNQWDRDDERLVVTVLDLHARHGGDLPGVLRWEAGVEGMLQLGHTSRLRPEPDLEQADVLAGGAVARGALAHALTRLKLTLEAGFASGDNDRNDDTVRHATFHPDYRVGLILFDELLGGVSARAADRLADAEHHAAIPHGTRHVPTNGGVTNAFYLWPRLAFEPLERLALRVGLLWAVAVADVVDPRATNVDAGGYNRNYFGGPADGRELGLELQVGLSYSFAPIRKVKGLVVGAGVEWARLWPGDAFADRDGDPPPATSRVGGRFTVAWRFR
jgi:hypothetical protein